MFDNTENGFTKRGRVGGAIKWLRATMRSSGLATNISVKKFERGCQAQGLGSAKRGADARGAV
jgi:hypothetical protein